MRSISVSYAKNNLSALLRAVREGATLTITDRGLPVARLVPPATTTGVPARAIDLAQRGVLTLPEREPTSHWFKGALPRPKGKSGMSAVEALIEERRTGR
jgi:prevent-host-death family protein